MKVSHKDQSVLEDFFGNLISKFGQEDELIGNKGLVHKYLGITIDYLILGKVLFTMFNHLKDVIAEATEDQKNSGLYYPGNDQLFKVDCDLPSLPQNDTELFHCHITRPLFASKRARPKIQICVAFLYTWVKSPT